MLPLLGWTVGMTADRRAEEQAELLRRRGATVVAGATIRTRPLGAEEGVAQAIAALIAEPPDILVLTTGIGTRALFDMADATGHVDRLTAALQGSTVMVRGPKALGAATTAGLQVSWQAPTAISDELIQQVQGMDGHRVAVQLDGRDRPVLADALRALGREVVEIPVYQWQLPDDPDPAVRLIEAVCDQRVDAVTFTSAPALWNMVEMAATAGCADRLAAAFGQGVAAVSIGSKCSQAARELGIEPAVEPERFRLGAMVLALAAHAEQLDAEGTIDIAGCKVVLRAAAVRIDGDIIELTGQERSVLSALLQRAGTVVSKAELARMAWPAGAAAHAVETGVSRLRQRLVEHLAITAVPRRGYMLTAL
jgi:uroporphyrinogen-III synthase